MKLNLIGVALLYGGTGLILGSVNAKIDVHRLCPAEHSVVCVACTCNRFSGYNLCQQLEECPPPITSPSYPIIKKDRQAVCPYGKKFTALCTLCECSGTGRDHCGLCTALPVRRNGQPEEVNKRLPDLTDNRFFNYEISGWI